MASPGHTTSDPVAAVIDDLTAHLVHLQEEGVRSIRVSATALDALHTAPATSSAPVAAAPAAPVRTPAAVTSPGLAAVAARIAECRLCPLCATRTNTVPGQGTPRPELVFVGEGPGADEDQQGLAFVGRAGQLLTRMIEAMGLSRDEVWIGNIVKCRPPNNRAPAPEEMEACLPYLREQIGLLKPRVIVCLGATAVKGLLADKTGITKLRGNWMAFEGIDTMPTYHPAYLLRNPPAKREVWEDMKAVLQRLGRPLPDRA